MLTPALFLSLAPQLFHMKIEEAAASLKLSLSTLKNSARDAGVKRWPQRKLSSLKGMHAAILADATVDGRKRQALFAQIEANLEEVMRDPNCGIYPSLEELRQVRQAWALAGSPQQSTRMGRVCQDVLIRQSTDGCRVTGNLPEMTAATVT